MSQAGIVVLEDANIPSDVPTKFLTDTGTGAIPVNHTIYILGGSGVTTDSSGDTITINVSSTGFTWNVVTSAMNPIILVPENGYICKGATPIDFILPASSLIGDTFRIVGYSNLWNIAQNAAQSISLGIKTTMAGVMGSLSATQ